MALNLGTALFTLAGNMAPLAKTLDQADGAAKSWAGKLRGSLESAGSAMMGLGSKMTLGITGPIVAGSLKAIDSASDLSETMNKINVVFDENASVVQAWAVTASESFGLSRQAALESAGTFGNLFTSMGMGTNVASDMARGLVGLAADLASFNNIDPTVALEKLRAGIVGEVEPLRTLGVNLNAVAVEAEAMRLGLVKSDVDMRKVGLATNTLNRAQETLNANVKKYGAESKQAATSRDAVTRAEIAVEAAMKGSKAELTAAMKAQAAYSLIMQQTGNAQGDFARTSEGLANSQRILKAQMADAFAALGVSLLPIAEKVVHFLSDMIGKFTALSPEVQRFIVIGAGIAAAIGPVVMILGALTTGLAALISPVGLVIGVIAALGVAFATNFGGIRDKVGEVLAGLAPAWEGFKTKLGELRDTAVTKLGELKTAFAEGGMPAVGAKLLTWGQQLILDLQAAAPGWVSSVKTAMAGVWASLTNSETGTLPAMADKLLTWGQQLILDLQAAAPGWVSSIQSVMAGVWSSLTNTATGGASSLTTGPGQGLTGLGEMLARLQPVFDLFAPTVDRIKTAFADMVVKLQPAIDKLPALGAAFAGLKPILDLVVGVVGVAAKLFGEVLASALNALPGILSGVISMLTGSIEGLANLLGGVIEIVKNLFAGDFEGALTAGKEMIAGHIEAMGEIFRGILKVVEEVFGGIWDAITNTVNDLIGTNIPQWGELKAAIVKVFTDLVTKIGDELGKIKGWVEKKLADVRSFISGFSLHDVGVALVQGLLNGIESMAGALVDKAKGVVTNAINAAKSLLGIHSPSTVFRDMGLQMMRGMGAGIEMGSIDALDRLLFAMKQMIDALAKFANDQVALNDSQNIRSAKAVTDPIATIINNVVDILGGLEKFKDFEIPTDVATRMEEASVAFAHIVDALALFANTQVAKGTSDNIHSAKAVMEAFGPMAEQLIRSLEMLDALAVWEPKVEGFEANAAALGLAVKTMIVKMAEVAQGISEEDLADALGLSFYLGTVATMLKDVPALLQTISQGTEAMSAIAAMDSIPKGLGPNIDRLAGFLAVLAGNLAAWFKDMPPNTAELAGQFADTIGPVLGVVKNTVDAMKALPAIGDVPAGLGPMINRLSGFLATLVGNLAVWTKDFDTVMVEKVSDFARNVSAVSSMIGGAVQAMTALNAFKETGDIRAKFDRFFKHWSYIFGEWIKLSREAVDWGDERVKKFSETLTSAGEALTKALSFMVDLGAWRMTIDLQERVRLFVGELGGILEALAKEFTSWDANSRDAIARFSESVGALFGGLKAAMEVSSAIPRTWGSYNAWADFQTWVMATFDSLKVWLESNYPDSIENADEFGPVRRWGEALGAIFGGLRAAMDWAVALPKSWTPPSNILMWNFVAWVAATFAELENMLSAHFLTSTGIVVITEEGMKLVSTFGQALGSIFGGLRAAMDWAISLPQSWIPPSGALTWNVLAWVSMTFAELQGMLENARFMTSTGVVVITEAGMRLVNAFGAAVGSVFGGLRAALDFAASLPASWSVNIGTWYPFLEWVEGVFAELQGFIEARWPSTPDEAQDFGPVAAFGQALGAIMGGLQAAMQMANQFSFTPPSAATFSAFLTWSEDTFARLEEWIRARFPESREDAATFGPVAAFGQALGAVMQGLVSSLDLFRGLASWAGPGSTFEARLRSFLTNVEMTFELVEESSARLDAAAVQATAVFGQAIGTLMQGLRSALDLFVALDAAPTGATAVEGEGQSSFATFKERVGNLMEAIGGTLAAFQTWVMTDSSSVWLPAAQVFLQGLGTFVSTLKQALDLFIALDEHGMPSVDTIQAFIDTLLQLFGTVLNSFNQTAYGFKETTQRVIADAMIVPSQLYGLAGQWASAGAALGGSFVGGLKGSLPGAGISSYLPMGGGAAALNVSTERRIYVQVDVKGTDLPREALEKIKAELTYAVQLGA